MGRVEEQRVDQEGDKAVRVQEQLLVDVLATSAARKFRQKESTQCSATY